MSQIYQQSPDEAALSLLSLSLAAAQAKPLQLPQSTDTNSVSQFNSSTTQLTGPAASIGSSVKQHRRLSSTGKARRRLSDARDAAFRPSPATPQASAPSLSLASLTLSSSPPQPSNTSIGHPPKFTSPIPIGRNTFDESGHSIQIEDEDEMMSFSGSLPDDGGMSVSASGGNFKGGKKRGTDHKCETCSKVYRHPSCLIKHRWEHTPHWREASKFVLSKHQQVQLLEAAAILSHLSPSSSTGTSLPEDRSLWPSFLSGGTLAHLAAAPPLLTAPALPPAPKIPISSSVPVTLSSFGPRLHDYTLSSSAARSNFGIITGPGITQVRPGLISVNTTPSAVSPVSASIPVPVPIRPEGLTGPGFHSGHRPSYGARSATTLSSYRGAGLPGSLAQSDRDGGESFNGGGGWSLPRSSLRSISGSSHSHSRSGSGSGDEPVVGSPPGKKADAATDGVEVVGGGNEGGVFGGIYGRGYGYGFGARGRWGTESVERGISVVEEDENDGVDVAIRKTGRDDSRGTVWDGMEMEMEMD